MKWKRKLTIFSLFVASGFIVLNNAFSLDKYPTGLAIEEIYKGSDYSSFLNDLGVRRIKVCFLLGRD